MSKTFLGGEEARKLTTILKKVVDILKEKNLLRSQRKLSMTKKSEFYLKHGQIQCRQYTSIKLMTLRTLIQINRR